MKAPLSFSLTGALVAYLMGRALRGVPGELRARLAEEWQAHVDEVPGAWPRLRFALGLVPAAYVIGREHAAATPARRGILAPLAYRAELPAVAQARALPRASMKAPVPAPAASASAVCEINTTPLIDVMLVLLVTLIVSLPMVTHAVKIELPASSPPDAGTPPPVVSIDIDADGTIVWDGNPVSGPARLEQYFAGAAAADPQPQIQLHPDRRARYDVVAKVLAAAQRHHLRQIGFAGTGEYR